MLHTGLSLHSHASGFYTGIQTRSAMAAERPVLPFTLSGGVMRLGCGGAGRRGLQQTSGEPEVTLLMLEMLFDAETTAGCQKRAAADERKYSAHLFMSAGSLSATLVTWMLSSRSPQTKPCRSLSSCSTRAVKCLIWSECRCRQQHC